MSDTELLLELLVESDWRVVRRRQREELLPDHVSRRYPRLPLDVRSFLEDLEAKTKGVRNRYLAGDPWAAW